MTLNYRTVWISDAHLGSRSAQAAPLSRFIKHLRCERLYLVGDIVDMWRLRSRWYWPGEHNNVIRRLLNQTKHNTDVIFIPGNHDEGARQFLNLEFGGIRVLPYAIHVTGDGRRLLVTHGDQYDLIVKHSRLTSMLGSTAYDTLVMTNRWINEWRARWGKPSVSLSMAIKMKVKSACMFISRFEEALIQEARHKGLDGVVCGHIHKPEIRTEGDIEYYNCGDWVESCSALVEHHDGRMELLDSIESIERALSASEPSHAVMPDEPELSELIAYDRLADHDPLPLTFGAPGSGKRNGHGHGSVSGGASGVGLTSGRGGTSGGGGRFS